jgi:glycosyltransferase involved in cell wall biosynthesis
MHILIDLQALQTESSGTRGIGRYSRALIEGIMRNAPDDKITLLLSGVVGKRNGQLRRALTRLRPDIDIQMWTAATPTSFLSGNLRRQAAEEIYKTMIAKIAPDVVLIPSLFEGLDEDVSVTLGTVPTAVVLYDLIPLVFSDIYLENADVWAWYHEKVAELKQADLLLAISDFSALDGQKYLNVPEDRIVSIGTDADEIFHAQPVDPSEWATLSSELGLTRPFLMYTGGIDHLKNISGLIQAFASLPREVYETHQLAIVCRVHDKEKKNLINEARAAGLPDGVVVFTGCVSDQVLVTLYNSCKAFVFPSWYEGFGLPVLEAMRCGAPVIGSNASSIPEVIGNEDALFDPHSTSEMAQMIERVLTDDGFRRSLREHAVAHARNFSWDKTAIGALTAMRALVDSTPKPKPSTTPTKPRLAFVSPLPPERSGISFYSVDLLPFLAKYYDIDLIVRQADIELGAQSGQFPVRDVAWFETNATSFDRILYQFGNSDFHSHMFELLDKFPGTVVLHDFFMSDIQHHMDSVEFVKALSEDSGYISVLDCIGPEGDYGKAIQLWPTNGRVLRAAEGVIIHSQHACDLAQKYIGATAAAADKLTEIPLLRVPVEIAPDARSQARELLGISPETLLICSFGYPTPNKCVVELVDGFEHSETAKNPNAQLVFVGDGKFWSDPRIVGSAIKDQVTVTGWTSDEVYQAYLAAADIAVQLRSRSRGESPAAVLDVQNYGVAAIVNAHGSLADLPEGSVLKIPDVFSDADLAAAIDQLAQDPELRNRIGSTARDIITTKHAPDACAEQYRDAIEHFYTQYGARNRALFESQAQLPANLSRDSQLAQAVADSFPSKPRMQQLFIDVSILALSDSRTGIQRVVRSILSNVLHTPPKGWRVEPVFIDKEIGRYRYARKFTCRFLDISSHWASDDPIDFGPGDLFVGLDLNFEAAQIMKGPLELMASAGVEVSFVAYDLLPVLMSQHFTPKVAKSFEKWLELLSIGDRVVTISQSVADEYGVWLADNNVSPELAPDLRWFHLGADVSNSVPTTGLPKNASKVLMQLGARPTFVMVGTVEPRKACDQVLAAFDALWAQGVEANLVIVGKVGWNVRNLVNRLRSHEQKGKKLIWLDSISDEYLEQIYAASDCLIAASHGEGFGLPLIEAARQKLPILARDIPVFREVAGDHAAYFDGSNPDALAQAIRDWLARHSSGQTIRSDDLPWSTWEQATEKFLEALNIDIPNDPT